MTNMKKAGPKTSPKTHNFNSTIASAQRARLLKRLEPVDTFSARNEMNLMMPAALIEELRNAGHNIKTQRIIKTDQRRHTHRGVARYYLSQSEA
ncbi:MAG TPA: hypothetical protein ENH72_04405 [Pseudomonas sabulinigri]|uniref:Winged helix-turn-helix domain-containing protein n=1 Tax=marine sediment metagenome TaxID=412755 RepID=A0A0F9V1P5_9ZZZZ|nr:hypothetical protein [Halopseudomonas sabulinigri]HEC51148.1 hypothetical protein [Halopseudomonas sabulinigri]